MKKVLSLFLALVMLALSAPAFMLAIAAEEGAPATSSYLVYYEDFETLDTTDSKNEILQKLGWYVPEDYRATDVADFSVVNAAFQNICRYSECFGRYV